MSLLDVGDRLAPRSDGPQEVALMSAVRRSDVEFDVLLRPVLRKLVILEQRLPGLLRRRLAVGNEVIVVDADLQGPLIPVERRTPRILRIGWIAPGAVRPDDQQVAKFEGRRLRVGD